MILVLAGTADGRDIVRMLADRGRRVVACVATAYGGELLAGSGAHVIIDQPLDKNKLALLIEQYRITAVIDATHPFAEVISAAAAGVCREKGVSYLCYRRPVLKLPESPLITFVAGYQEAAEMAAAAGQVIFLTAGSKSLDVFLAVARAGGRRLVARVLPVPAVLTRCLELGLTAADLVAMQGPFSVALNRALLVEYRASVLVTKESGAVGGTDTKVVAALDLGIPVVIIKRPEPPAGAVSNAEEILKKLECWESEELESGI
ncbi:MAG: precorrin-6A reductase [Peptococcaceae bacterium]|nr:MAG: precorrin-6A reductase [Peptococcaceae bacterium]